MSDTYCVLSDIGISVHNGGHVSLCNGSRQIFYSANNEAITLNKHSLKEAWNSKTRIEIQQALKNGVRHSNCDDCWIKEDGGFLSMRQIHNKNLGDQVPAKNSPRVIVLKPGNVCNLACRHCDPNTSSGWYNDHYNLHYKPKNIAYQTFLQNYNTTKESYDNTNDNVWSVLKEWTANVVYYDLYGAEPLLIKPVLALLTHSVETGAARNQSIHINTNGTIWRDEFYKIFSQFKNVYLDISVDGIEKHFDYLRYPADWTTTFNNIVKYKELQNKYQNIQVGITITISIYNIFYISDIENYFNNIGLTCSFNMLHNPESMNVRSLPNEIKNILQEKNKKYSSINNFMNLPIENQEKHFREFFSTTKNIDQLRDQKYKNYFPEFYQLIQNYE